MKPAQPDRESVADVASLLERAYVERGNEGDEIRSRVLDAACAQFGALGVRRCTMDDIARRAEVSRVTVYRRFATKDVLVEQVVLREFRRYFDRFRSEIRGADTAAERVVLGFVSSLRAIRDNPIIGGLLVAEPDLLVGSMIGDQGHLVAIVRQFVAGQLGREQRAGCVPAEVDAELTAEVMVRISASFLAIPSHIVDLDDDAELAALARRYLVPMLAAPRPEPPHACAP